MVVRNGSYHHGDILDDLEGKELYCGGWGCD